MINAYCNEQVFQVLSVADRYFQRDFIDSISGIFNWVPEILFWLFYLRQRIFDCNIVCSLFRACIPVAI